MLIHRHRWCLLALALVLTCCVPVLLFAVEEATTAEGDYQLDELMSQRSALDWTLGAAIVLAITHLATTRLHPVVARNEARISSFGGGLATGYDFLHLMSELDSGHALVGNKIHVLVLAGFLLYYGVEYGLSHSGTSTESGGGRTSSIGFAVQIAFGWIYNWLIIYSLPETIQIDGLRIVPIMAALAFHVFYSNYQLSGEYPVQFKRWGRFVLASAPIVAWAGDVFYFEDNPSVSDLLTALLAGALIYRLFKDELPEDGKSSFVWFLIGTATFLLVDLAAGWG